MPPFRGRLALTPEKQKPGTAVVVLGTVSELYNSPTATPAQSDPSLGDRGDLLFCPGGH